jgi:hypothetical protein
MAGSMSSARIKGVRGSRMDACGRMRTYLKHLLRLVCGTKREAA